MILVTGGTRAGKSRVAQNICAAVGPKVLYIATAMTMDAFTAERFRRSRQQRPYHWEIYKGFMDIGKEIDNVNGKYDAIMIESLHSLVAELLGNADFIRPGTPFRECEKKIMDEINLITTCARRSSAVIVFVTTETAIFHACADGAAQAAFEILGRVNQYVAAICAEVYLVVSGIPVKIK